MFIRRRDCGSLLACLLLAWALALTACQPGGEDAGPPPYRGNIIAGGYTECGDTLCQPGQTCQDRDLCYLGCSRDDECAEGERCAEENLGGFCQPEGSATCGDGICSLGEHEGSCPGDCAGQTCDAATQGWVECGTNTCAPGEYCANAIMGYCYDGCISSTNCACGRTCDASVGQPGLCTVPLEVTDPCGDLTCGRFESPVDCPADCTWVEFCQRFCLEMEGEGCFDQMGGMGDCPARCAASDETMQRSFANCVSGSGGPTSCPTQCVDQLAEATGGPPG